ncbi:MAG: Nif3-like dinuclear metal center hexameric protein [Elusimicrobia bacterium]|nr:Nif3-like dinuclear metal center hexameric protein [Elusimicrobiota bacterium]
MPNCKEIILFLNNLLRAENIADDAFNGLQVEGKEEVKKIAFGVSANLELFNKSAAQKADMIIVHHGLLWGKIQPLAGAFGRRVKFLHDRNISLAAYHLPLDKHERLGNNAQLLKFIGAKNIKPFGKYEGQLIGFKGVLSPALPREKIQAILVGKPDAKPVCINFGPQKIKTIGAVSGGAGSIVFQAAEEGLDMFITGETPEPAQEICREAGMNFIGLGHYNSEKAGVMAIMRAIGKKVRVKTFFVDVPNKF